MGFYVLFGQIHYAREKSIYCHFRVATARCFGSRFPAGIVLKIRKNDICSNRLATATDSKKVMCGEILLA